MKTPCAISLFGAILLLAGPVAGDSLCDPNLPQDSKGPMAYHMRGDRCEGIYAQQVSSISVEVRSLVASFPAFDPAKAADLELRWTAPPGDANDVRLRAFCFKPGTHYRMDAAVPAAKGAYRWPTDVLASMQLERDDLGLVAWTDLPGPGKSAHPVFLPLRAGGGAAKAEDGYEVTLIPSDRLKEVHVTVSRLDGQDKAITVSERDLGYGYYPPGEPTVFQTGKLGPPGFYRLAITSTLRSGDPVANDLVIYHPGD
jgi:hypothetical protein